MFRLFQRRTRIRGYIGYFKLADWWLSTFTEAERARIEAIFHPLGGGSPRPLTQGEIGTTSETATGLLTSLAGWFSKPGDRSLARRILAKAQEHGGTNVLDRHFLYQQMIRTYYPDRDSDPSALDTAISACEKQIALAPQAAKALKREFPKNRLPSHVGYYQLAIIREKQHAYGETIRLCREAKRGGWDGDWDKRIERCERRSAD